MTVQTALAIALVVGFGAAQYILMYQALGDLLRRTRVRGDNKVAWGLLILCVPIIGALVYGWMGPTSLMRRSVPNSEIDTPSRLHPSSGRVAARRNITPISDARRSRRTTASHAQPAERANPRRYPRTGS